MSEADKPKVPETLLVSMKVGEKYYNIAPPLGIYQLYNYISQRGFPCDVLDRELYAEEDFIENARKGKYDIIGMSVSHTNMAEELELLWKIREAVDESGKPAIFIAGGQEATLNWEQWLDVGIDVILLGFGEHPLYQLCQRVDKWLNSWEELNLEKLLDGMRANAFKDSKGEKIYNPAPLLTQEVFHELFYEQIQKNYVPFHKYWDMLNAKSADTSLGASEFIIENVRLYTTSHCPRRCGFCNSQSFLPEAQVVAENLMTTREGSTVSKGKLPIIHLDAQHCADVVEFYIKQYGARSFLFSDDDFPVGSKFGLERVVDFCDLMVKYKEEGRISKEVRFSCQARVADFLVSERIDGEKRKVPNWEVLKAMKRAGFTSIGMGVETFNDRLMQCASVNKVGITVDNCLMIIDAMLEVGLAPQYNLILGIPESTVDEMAETLQIASEYLMKACDIAITPKMLALPGAPVYDKGLYKTVYREWKNPYNGQVVKIADYFVPNDPLVAHAIENLDEERKTELKRISDREGWSGKIVHKRIVGLSTLIALSRLIERDDLVEEFNSVLEEILHGSVYRKEQEMERVTTGV